MISDSAIHPSIVKAICRIMTTVTSVKKSEKNTHGGYSYAGTDDIYAACTHKMGECGLILLSREDECEIVRVEKDGKTSQWAKLVFSFVLATEEGTWADPKARRTLYLQVTGPQTFQAAQSYAEKAYMRSLFKLPTGDKDLDSMPQGETEEMQVALSQPGKRKSSSASKKDGTDKLFNALRVEISGALNPEHLRSIKENNITDWNAMPARWVDILDQEYEDMLENFHAREAAE